MTHPTQSGREPTEPRIHPIPIEDWHPDLAELRDQMKAAGQPASGLRCTLANHPRLLRRAALFINYILFSSKVSARDRELTILRTSKLCNTPYEWAHHYQSARDAGLTDAEIAGVLDDEYQWNEADAALLKAVDELHANYRIDDATWAALAARYDVETLMDFVFTAGQYHLMAMAINSFGIDLESGFAGFGSEARPASLQLADNVEGGHLGTSDAS